MAAAVVAAIVGVGGFFTYSHMETVDHLPAVSSTTQSNGTLTLSGADLDEAATAQAVAAIQSGQANPLIADLTPQQRQEVASGQRQFYKLPVLPKTASKTQGDRIQIAVDGAVYASYDTAKGPYTLDLPLKFGDSIAVTCLELAPGKSVVTVGIGTMLNPIQAELAHGESKSFSVVSHGNAEDYGWFKAQASNGNAVAEYGLGHMYQYGIGVPQCRQAAARQVRRKLKLYILLGSAAGNHLHVRKGARK